MLGGHVFSYGGDSNQTRGQILKRRPGKRKEDNWGVAEAEGGNKGHEAQNGARGGKRGWIRTGDSRARVGKGGGVDGGMKRRGAWGGGEEGDGR